MRTIPEWVGRTDDTKLPDEVKRRILRRQWDWYHSPRCHVCSRRLDHKNKPEFDHIPALWEGGQNRETMIFAVCAVPCHRDHTIEDTTKRAEMKRGEKKRAGIKRKVRHPFRGWRRLNGEIVWNPHYKRP